MTVYSCDEKQRANAVLVLDSVFGGCDRLTTFELTLPKWLVAQVKNHRTVVSNAASSRAVPYWKVRQQVLENPYTPPRMGAHGAGMQPGEYLETDVTAWLYARDLAVEAADHLAGPDPKNPRYAKEILNRVLEPYMWTTMVATATKEHWEWFIRLREDESAAQSDMQYIAADVRQALADNTPTTREVHAPYSPTGDPVQSVEACARVSYGNQHKPSREPGRLYEQLLQGGHYSPFEHVAYARPGHTTGVHGSGWLQLRHKLGA